MGMGMDMGMGMGMDMDTVVEVRMVAEGRMERINLAGMGMGEDDFEGAFLNFREGVALELIAVAGRLIDWDRVQPSRSEMGSCQPSRSEITLDFLEMSGADPWASRLLLC